MPESYNQIVTKKPKKKQFRSNGVIYKITKVDKISNGVYRIWFTPLRQYNPSTLKNKWIKVSAIKLVKGKLLIKK